MDLIIAFVIFAGSMVCCLIWDITMSAALLAGLACFFAAGLHRGFSAQALGQMVCGGAKKSFVVLRILLLIGLITALWRAGGTIGFFVYHSISVITPHLFLLIAFLLTSLLSFALGTSFGIAGTAGVILMVLARSGGVDPVVCAGAVMSGAYFGDRCAPASSSATLVAVVTDTSLYTNVKQMLRTGALPMLITLGIYAVLSWRHPIADIDPAMLTALEREFDLGLLSVVPAVIMLVLPLLKVEVGRAMMGSIAASCLLTVTLEGKGLTAALRYCIFGYQPQEGLLADVLAGGGLVSMLDVTLIVLISCTYSGIFVGTGMLDGVQEKIASLAGRTGLFFTMITTSLLTIGVFCNQTIATMLCSQLMGNVYEKRGATREELAIDMENSVITLAGVVPWSIACAVPLGMLGVGMEAIPYGVLLYMIPLCYLFTKRIWYRQNGGEGLRDEHE